MIELVSEPLGTAISDWLYFAWLLTLAMLPVVTSAALLYRHRASAVARKVNTIALSMAVWCVVFPISSEFTIRWTETPTKPAESIGGTALTLLSLMISIPCGIIASRARAVLRSGKTNGPRTDV